MRSQTGEWKKTEQSTISEVEEKVANERTLLLLLLFVRLSLLSPLFSFQQLLLNLWWKLEAWEEEL